MEVQSSKARLLQPTEHNWAIGDVVGRKHFPHGIPTCSNHVDDKSRKKGMPKIHTSPSCVCMSISSGWGKLYRKPCCFAMKNLGVSCEFSRKPIQWCYDAMMLMFKTLSRIRIWISETCEEKPCCDGYAPGIMAGNGRIHDSYFCIMRKRLSWM